MKSSHLLRLPTGVRTPRNKHDLQLVGYVRDLPENILKKCLSILLVTPRCRKCSEAKANHSTNHI